MHRRVVVTGMGVVSPIGNSLEQFWSSLIHGRGGIRRHPDPAIQLPVGWVEHDPTARFSRMALMVLDRVSQLALMAARTGVQQSGLAYPLGDETGVFFGSGMGGTETSEKNAHAAYFSDGNGDERKRRLGVLAAMTHAPATQVALAHGIKGECQTYSSACASSAYAIGEAFRRIRDGYLDVALAGGSECVLTPSVVDVWRGMSLLCEDPPGAPGSGCRPFSSDRSGFAMGEGAGVLVLEELGNALDRGVEPLLEITGYGVSHDASHVTRPSADGQALAMLRALDDARLRPAQINHINAHGSATRAGDLAEAQAIHRVFGERARHLPLTATKSMHGHLLGATSVVEFIAMALTLQNGVVPPTAYCHDPDPQCGLDVVHGQPRRVNDMEYAMSNSFAFGGSNAALVVRRWG